MQSALEGADFGEITQNKGHCAGQGHSRSPISVPIESSYTIPMSDYDGLIPYRAPFSIAFDRSQIAVYDNQLSGLEKLTSPNAD